MAFMRTKAMTNPVTVCPGSKILDPMKRISPLALTFVTGCGWNDVPEMDLGNACTLTRT